MIQAIEATYKDGVFIPLSPPVLEEGQRVTLWLLDADSARQISHLRPADREFIEQLSEQRADVFRRLSE
jgi:predicted DNA-binding antitoxin AbrB/MazE fold protein